MRGSIYSEQKCQICGGVFVYNERQRGLFCPNHPKQQATGRFIVQFGRQVRRRCRTLDQAERLLTGIRYEVDRNTFDSRDYQADNPLSFQNLTAQWLLIKKKEVKVSSYRNLANYMSLAVTAWGHRNVKEISYSDFEDFFHSLAVSEKTKSNMKSCFHSFWTWLQNRKVIIPAQFPEFPTIRYQLGFRKIIDKVTQEAIIEEVRRISYSINPKIWMGIKWLATYIAIRPGELVKMQEKDIQLGLGVFLVRHTKEGKEKFVPILPEDVELVRSLPVGLPYLPFFRHQKGVSGCRPGQPFGEKYLYKWWKKACENLGIEGVDLYGGTRHSSATALKQFLSPEQIKIGTMHSTNKAFDRYFQRNSGDALNVFHLARMGTQVEHTLDHSKNDNLLKLKVKNGGGGGS